MTDRSSLSPERVPTRPRTLMSSRARALALGSALAVLGLVASACGGGGQGPELTELENIEEAPEGADHGEHGLMSTRPGAGISAAGGYIHHESVCREAMGQEAMDHEAMDHEAMDHEAMGAHPGGPIKIGYVGPDLDELAAIGLETLVFDGPTNIVDAYINQINTSGGINGHCFEFVSYEWGLADPVASFGQICAELPEHQPLVVLSLGLQDTTYECITLAAQVPTFGLFATKTDAQFAAAQGLLFVDQGSDEYLLSTGVDAAFQAEVLSPEDRVGLLHNDGANAESEQAALAATSNRLGVQVVAETRVPADFQDLGLLLIESQVRLLQGELTDDEAQEVQRAWAALPPEQADTLRRMEQYFLDAAADLQGAGVTAVLTTSDWSDVRRFIRAANVIGWFPEWIITDDQPALLVLTALPQEQGLNLVQVSSRRAAGDAIPDIDRGCVSLRNTATAAETFSHRFHTDAWNLITSTCDYLDVIFGAISRVVGPLTRETFVEALSATEYETVHGSFIKFTAEDRFANDRFRLLRADPNCVLDDWGCMRSLTEWISPDPSLGTG